MPCWCLRLFARCLLSDYAIASLFMLLLMPIVMRLPSQHEARREPRYAIAAMPLPRAPFGFIFTRVIDFDARCCRCHKALCFRHFTCHATARDAICRFSRSFIAAITRWHWCFSITPPLFAPLFSPFHAALIMLPLIMMLLTPRHWLFDAAARY